MRNANALILIVALSLSSIAVAQDKTKPGRLEGLGGVNQFNIGLVAGDTIQRTRLYNEGNPLVPQFPHACEGSACSLSEMKQDSLQDKSGESSLLSVPSPIGNVFDTMYSQKMQELMETTLPQSALALSAATWQSSSSTIAAGVERALEVSLGLSTNRYLAEQNVRDTLKSGGENGEALLRAYQGCVTAAIQGGKATFASAQESCLGGWYRQDNGGGVSAFDSENVTQDDNSLDFAHHPSHPLFVDPITGQKNQEKAPGLFTFDAGRDDSGSIVTKTSEKTEIYLTDLLFTQPIIKTTDSNAQKFVAGIRDDWVKLFGNVRYSMMPKDTTNKVSAGSFLQIDMQRVAPTFKYEDEIKDRKTGIILGTHTDPFDGVTTSAFKQFMRFKTDVVYQRLMLTMSHWCSKTYHRAPKNAPGAWDDSNFWFPMRQVSSNHISYDDVRTLSTRFLTFNAELGISLYALLTDKLKRGPEYCDLIDPSIDGADSITTMSKVLDIPDTPGSLYAPKLSFFYKLSEDIAAAQINDILNESRKVAMSLSGGSLETQARQAALALLNDAAGTEWNYESALNAIMSEVQKDQDTLTSYINGLPEPENK